MRADLIDAIAETIWQAEWKRAGNGGLRKVPWSEISPTDQERYRFIAREVAALSVAAEPEPVACSICATSDAVPYICDQHGRDASPPPVEPKAEAVTIAARQEELARCRVEALMEAAKIVRARADFSMPKGIGPRPPWHRFAYECAYTLEKIAALGGSDA